MKRLDNKSNCPINCTVEVFGDPWSLLILRDMLGLGKKAFGEFMESTERIGPSVLAEKLVYLEKHGVIVKSKDPADGRKTMYWVTDNGIELIPMLYELALWGTKRYSDPDDPDPWLASAKYDKQLVILLWREAVKAGDSFMFGSNSVAAKLNLFS